MSDFPKILVITHGGFIMEMMNVFRSLNKEKIVENNKAKNSSITVYSVFCKNCGSKCYQKCKNEIEFKLLLDNDNSHLPPILKQ